jgi:hypothetical protein
MKVHIPSFHTTMKQTTKLLSSLTRLPFFSPVLRLRGIAHLDRHQGRQVTASFIGLDGENIILQTADGAMHKLPADEPVCGGSVAGKKP